MLNIHFAGHDYDCLEAETVLEALLRQQVDIPYSCRHGICQACMLRGIKGQIPAPAQQVFRDTMRLQGYFLACQCRPVEDMEIGLPVDAEVYGRAVVLEKDFLAPKVCRVLLEPATPLYYHAGQFINLRRRDDGLVRSYSLASVPHQDKHLEIHVKRMQNGRMSNWICDHLQPGQALDLHGPNGDCFYLPGKTQQNLLLIGTGTGLAPLFGIVRDALHSGHQGDIHLYHGSHESAGIYYLEILSDLAVQYPNFHYTPCVSGAENGSGLRPGRADDNAFTALHDLSDWRIFLCGSPAMVKSAKRRAYLAGARLADIYIDPFELADLRRKPRD